MKSSARHTLHDFGTLIFRKKPEHVEGQLAFGGRLVFLAADSNLLAAFDQLADDDRLVRCFAGETVSGVKIDSVEQIGFGVLDQADFSG